MLLGFQNLLLEGVGLGEGELDLLGGVVLVDLGHGIDLVHDSLLINWVEVDLGVLLAIKGYSGVFADDGCREDL